MGKFAAVAPIVSGILGLTKQPKVPAVPPPLPVPTLDTESGDEAESKEARENAMRVGRSSNVSAGGLLSGGDTNAKTKGLLG